MKNSTEIGICNALFTLKCYLTRATNTVSSDPFHRSFCMQMSPAVIGL